MTSLFLAFAALRDRWLVSSLCILSFAGGIAVLSLLFILSHAVEESFSKNANGIDLVIGAKGSPLQMVLSSVYQSDVPTGNIDVADADKIARHPQIAKTIPLALGDNYRGFRIAGTTPDYIDLYHGQIKDGRMFADAFDVVVGSETGLRIGDTFNGAHGFSADSDDIHDFHSYKVVGVLKPTGSVIDRMIMTSVDSVRELHLHPDAHDEDAEEEKVIAHQVTALLIKVKNPIAVMNLPREINRMPHVQAAQPGYEIARLMQNLGIGKDSLAILAFGILGVSGLMLFAVLASSLAQRRYDLGIMRVMGAGISTLATTLLAEAVLVALSGGVIGIVLARVMAIALSGNMSILSGVLDHAHIIHIYAEDGWLLLIALATGLLAAILPLFSVSRHDVADLLAGGR